MDGIKLCSVSPLYGTRGFIALGVCSIITIFWICLMPVRAMEMEPTITEPTETEEEVIDEFTDDTGAVMDDDTVSDSDGEAGPDNEEGEVASQTAGVRCTCGETIISYLESKAIMEAELEASQEPVIYQTPEEFEATPALLTRFEYESVKRLNFMQYGMLIIIGLIFILIFKKK